MENPNNLSYVIQLTDNESENESVYNKNSEIFIADSLYQFLASDLMNSFKIIIKNLADSDISKISYLSQFIEEIYKNQIPLIYKLKLSTNCANFESGQIKIIPILSEMIAVLQKLGDSKISFSTESELISIFQMIFSENLFENEIFCLISAAIYRVFKQTGLASWKLFNYKLFIHCFLLQYGIF